MSSIANNTVIVRADASAAMGAGHLMRSAALAKALSKYAPVVLATATQSQTLVDHVERLGVAVARISGDDAGETLSLAPGGAAMVIADGYQFDAAYLSALRAGAARVAVIDDGARLSEYAVDALIDHNIGALRQPYAAARDAQLLLGPSFSLMRPEFSQRLQREVPATPSHGLITLGGADPANATSQVLAAISRVTPRIRWTVLVGGGNPYAAAIREMAGTLGYVDVIENTGDMASLLSSVDVAVAAVGGTIWELSAIGVPALVVSTTAVQRQVGEAAAAYGAHEFGGDVQSHSTESLALAISRLIADRSRRAELVRLGQMLIDGRGAERVAAALMAPEPAWRVRPAAIADAEPIWEIASDPAARAQSFNTKSFSFPEHERWFSGRLDRADIAMWVADRDGVVGGFVRYERESGTAVISVAVATACRGRGLGTELLRATATEACRRLGVDSVYGLVMNGNPGSQAIFSKAGFRHAGERRVNDSACLVFEWTAEAA